MIAGRAVVADRAHATNDDLINNLRRMGVLTSCALSPEQTPVLCADIHPSMRGWLSDVPL